MFRFAATIFLSAFLLFLVQPLIAKYILPWFGGGSGVWSACLLFFQCMLLAGYLYAHLLATRVQPRMQMIVHLSVLAGGLVFLPIVPSEMFKPLDASLPVWRIVMLLAATLGLPYLALSATGPLVQAWFAQQFAGTNRSPYRLYALSNLGSLLALLGYPFVIEPLLSRTQQAFAWSGLFVVFALLCGWCAVAQGWRTRDAAAVNAHDNASSTSRLPTHQKEKGARGSAALLIEPRATSRVDRALWVILPMCASIMLLAATTQLSEEIAPMPFVWVLPLATYLITFIIAFEWPRLYDRRVFVPLALAVPWVYLAVLIDTHAGLATQALLYLAVLLVCCMIAHGETYRLRPEPARLTGFYLAIALGGALGGGFVTLVAPAVFSMNLEIHLAMFACIALLGVCMWRDPTSWLYRGAQRPAWLGMALSLALAGFLIRTAVSAHLADAVIMLRSFYGSLVVRVAKDQPRNIEYLKLFHGRICHGSQSLSPAERYLPLTYYTSSSGIGLLMKATRPKTQANATQPVTYDDSNAPAHITHTTGRRIAVLGLGAGALAAWGEPGDFLRFYEINPQIERLAREPFTYLQDSRAQTEVVLGDGRLMMEREQPQEYDIIVLDAFSGDAVPTHLLTREAFATYRRHLRSGGAIAVNVTNRYLELHPVVHRLALDAGMHAAMILTPASPTEPEKVLDAHWMIVTDDLEMLQQPEIASVNMLPAGTPRVHLWTDDYCNVLEILR